jgi:outer membrane protein assembly factor BamB
MKWLLAMIAALGCASGQSVNWPAFHGGDNNGYSSANLPVKFGGKTRWKTPLPGLAHSSPVIWGDKIFVTTAISSDGKAPLKVGLYGSGDSANDNGPQRWVLICLDKRTGKILWQQTAHEGVAGNKRHTKATHANSTPVVDGKRVVAYFGSEGVYAYSLDGTLLWSNNLGRFDPGPQGYDLQWGTASSPALFEDKVILQCDQKIGSFLVVLSAETGKEIWRTSRDEVSHHSWATPTVVKASGRTQIVTNGWPYIVGYDLATGRELWRLKSAGDIVVPTPVFAHNLIFVANAHGGPAPLYAIKPDASGELNADTLAWSQPRNGAYMQTPLIVGDLLYSCSDQGVLKVYDARSGKLHYTQRLGEGLTGFTSSPVAAGTRVYFADEEGEVHVIEAGTRFKELGKNSLGEVTMATPAISENTIYYRTRGHLIAISESK